MREEHFDLLSQPHRDLILLGLGNIAGDLPGVFMFFAGDLAGISFWAALHLRWAGLTGVFQSLIFGDAFACGFAVRVRIIASELLEHFTFGADILVVPVPHSKSMRDHVPSVRAALSSTGMWGLMLRSTPISALIHRHYPQSNALDQSMSGLCGCESLRDTGGFRPDRRTDQLSAASDLGEQDLPARTHKIALLVLPVLVPSSPNPPIDMTIESANRHPSKEDFSTEFAPLVEHCVFT